MSDGSTNGGGGIFDNPGVPPYDPRSGSVVGVGRVTSAPNSGNNVTPSKAAMQMQKMKDANTKYKNLLKMAKERIEQQEVELKKLRGS
jgi:flagellar basal body rod protein FlgB